MDGRRLEERPRWFFPRKVLSFEEPREKRGQGPLDATCIGDIDDDNDNDDVCNV